MRSAALKTILVIAAVCALARMTVELPQVAVPTASRAADGSVAVPMIEALPTAVASGKVRPGATMPSRRPRRSTPTPPRHSFHRRVASTRPNIRAFRLPNRLRRQMTSSIPRSGPPLPAKPARGTASSCRASAGRVSETRALLHRAGASILRVNTIDGSIVAIVSAEDIRWMAGQPSTSRLSTDAQGSGDAGEVHDGVTLRSSMGLKKDGHLIEGSGSFDRRKNRRRRHRLRHRALEGIDATVSWRSSTSPGPAVSRRSAPYDDYGHGTHVAGLIGGTGSLSSDRFRGPAMKVQFVGYKVLDETGAGYTSHVIAALDHAVANRTRSAYG